MDKNWLIFQILQYIINLLFINTSIIYIPQQIA